MDIEEFKLQAANRHSGRPFRGMYNRGWFWGLIDGKWQWWTMRIGADLDADILSEYRAQGHTWKGKIDG